ncbi:MAG: hypothetical protein JW751_25070 [Polyangiaceae bacterium]|nr:hypothetical protein [Polyangiaceae bacterium]
MARRRLIRDDGVFAPGRGRCAGSIRDGAAENRPHVVFRPRGGSGEDDDLVTLCPRRHLEGIHEERLVAARTADLVRWTIGTPPLLWVKGRERLRAQRRITGTTHGCDPVCISGKATA